MIMIAMLMVAAFVTRPGRHAVRLRSSFYAVNIENIERSVPVRCCYAWILSSQGKSLGAAAIHK